MRRLPPSKILSHQTVIQPSVDSLIADAMSILELELLRLKRHVQSGRALLPDESRILNGYIKGLTELAREDREQQKGVDLSDMSTEEIIKLLQNSPKQIASKPVVSADADSTDDSSQD